MRKIAFVLVAFFTLSMSAQTYSKDLEKQAKKGDAQAQCEIGQCYLYAYGIAADAKKAKKWLESSAKQGHAEAMYHLAMAAKNENDSLWTVQLAKAAIAGSAKAQYLLYQNVGDREWLQKAADQGQPDALYELAQQTNNRTEKLKLLEKAVAQGNSMAQNEIDMLHQQIEKEEKERKEKELLAKMEEEKKRAERAAQLAMEKQEEQDVKEGRRLPSLTYLRKHTIFLSYDNELGDPKDESFKLFQELSNADFNEMMGVNKMDELDLLKYKKSERYKQDQIRFENKVNQLFSYVVNLKYNKYPKVDTEFSTKGLTIKTHESIELPLRQTDYGHIGFSNGFYFPVQPNVISFEKGRRKIFFPCADLDLIYKMKENVQSMALVIMCKPGIVEPPFYYFANPVAMYIIDKRNGEVLLDLRKYIRGINSDAEKKKEVAALRADFKEHTAQRNKQKGTYHQTPKEERCIFCWGVGYFKTKENGVLTDVNRCFNCYGRGYTLEHYY